MEEPLALVHENSWYPSYFYALFLGNSFSGILHFATLIIALGKHAYPGKRIH